MNQLKDMQKFEKNQFLAAITMDAYNMGNFNNANSKLSDKLGKTKYFFLLNFRKTRRQTGSKIPICKCPYSCQKLKGKYNVRFD